MSIIIMTTLDTPGMGMPDITIMRRRPISAGRSYSGPFSTAV
jgi:hypothetical protein